MRQGENEPDKEEIDEMREEGKDREKQKDKKKKKERKKEKDGQPERSWIVICKKHEAQNKEKKSAVQENRGKTCHLLPSTNHFI